MIHRGLSYSTAVGYETKILILTFAGSVLLAAAYLYVKDLLYSSRQN